MFLALFPNLSSYDLIQFSTTIKAKKTKTKKRKEKEKNKALYPPPLKHTHDIMSSVNVHTTKRSFEATSDVLFFGFFLFLCLLVSAFVNA